MATFAGNPLPLLENPSAPVPPRRRLWSLRRLRWLLLGGLLCGAASPLDAAPGAAPVAPGKAATPAAPAASVLPFIDDDFAAAQAKAVRLGKLLVVDAWAPWCHTCLSMRNFVFSDGKLLPLADRFVYLAVDTDKPENAAFVERFPTQSLPTMLVLDVRGKPAARPEDTVVARWIGAMTTDELLGRLTQLLDKADKPGAAAAGPLQAADAAASAKRFREAAPLYQRIAEDPALVSLRPQARLGQIQALRGAGLFAECAQLADTALPQLGKSALLTDFVSYAADCAGKMADVDARQRLQRRLQSALVTVVKDPQAALSVDDRSDGYGTAVELLDALGDKAGGDRLTQARLELLEAAAGRARTPAEASTFDAHRLDCYRRLKRYAPAEQMLLASLRAFPKDYNPPARLALLYFDMGRLEDALVRIDEALALSYGPRRARYLELKANILHGLGRTHAAVQSLEQAIGALEAAQGPSEKVANLRQHVAALVSTLTPEDAPAEPSEGTARAKAAPKKSKQVARRGP